TADHRSLGEGGRPRAPPTASLAGPHDPRFRLRRALGVVRGYGETSPKPAVPAKAGRSAWLTRSLVRRFLFVPRRGRIRAMTFRSRAALLITLAIASSVVIAQQKIYWGDEVPAGWHGQWPAEVQTVAERSGFTRTVSSLQLLEFISALKGKS